MVKVYLYFAREVERDFGFLIRKHQRNPSKTIEEIKLVNYSLCLERGQKLPFYLFEGFPLEPSVMHSLGSPCLMFSPAVMLLAFIHLIPRSLSLDLSRHSSFPLEIAPLQSNPLQEMPSFH